MWTKHFFPIGLLSLVAGCGSDYAEPTFPAQPDAGHLTRSPGLEAGQAVMPHGHDAGHSLVPGDQDAQVLPTDAGNGSAYDCAAAPDAGCGENKHCLAGACVVNRCGDGVRAGAEECDDGNQNNTDSCTNDCKEAQCGDGLVETGEQCDDGNLIDTDHCTDQCKNAQCGDGILADFEACDDGNNASGDGCDGTCKAEAASPCGNGHLDSGEECDDGNRVDTDGCTNVCKKAKCGDGIVETGVEQCDDGNTNDQDSCHNDCTKALSACQSCLQAQCASTDYGDLYAGCYAIDGTAAAGPGQGQLRSNLCASLVDCEISTGCAFKGKNKGGALDCYCGIDVGIASCSGANLTGPCRTQAEAAAESTNVDTVLANFTDMTLAAGGFSNLLDYCGEGSCSTQCQP